MLYLYQRNRFELLTKNKGDCLKKTAIQEKDKRIKLELNDTEKISMWTIIALSHDLGYPLQKAKSIITITQEWGRKNITELYVKSEQRYELKDIGLKFDSSHDGKNNGCEIKEMISVNDRESAITLIRRFREQALIYVTIFRDGQDTDKRDFSFKRNLTIEAESVSFEMTLEIKYIGSLHDRNLRRDSGPMCCV